MNLFNLIGQIFKPAVELVDELHTSEEEKLAAKAATLETYARALTAGLEYENQQLEVRAKIVEAEAKSEHWLTSTWRPITMLTFLVMLTARWFGLAPELTPDVEELVLNTIQLGLGGYVIGRSAEKAIVPIVSALKRKDET